MQFFQLRSVFLLTLISVIVGEDMTTKKPEIDYEDYHYDCKKIAWKIAKKVIGTFRQCTAELRERIPDDKERSKYIQCAVKCTLEKLTLINNSTGYIDDADIGQFLLKVMKPHFLDVGKVVVGGCAETFGLATLEERNGEFCVPHGDLLKCLQNQLTEIC